MVTRIDFCSERAQLANEPLIGTAPRHDMQVVMGVPKRLWEAQPENMDHPAGRLAQHIAPLKGQITLTLRHVEAAEEGTLWLFPHRLRFEGLTEADYPRLIKVLLNGEISIPHQPMPDESIIMVCAHGKRDAACAKFGGLTLTRLQQLAPDNTQIWEASHLGGHRFAGTVVVQPQSHYYGWINPGDVPDLLHAVQSGTVLTTKYRGNAHYPAPLQAAELWGWQQLDGHSGEVYLLNPVIEGQQAWVEVVTTQNGITRQNRLRLYAEPYTFFPNSNSDATKERLIWQVAEVG